MTRSRAIAVGLIIIAAVAVGGYVAYDQVLRGDSAAVLALPSASPVVGASSARSVSLDRVLAGTWTVARGSQAGYRVRERLANLPAESDAVGRTSDVSGSIALATNGSITTLNGATISVDTTTIASDKPMRDNRLRNEGLQTSRFPTATFKLARPVEVPAAALAGTAADITLTGDLTLHGVTRSVQIPAKAQLVNGTIQVAGSIGFPLADYSIVAPNVGGFIVSIADQGTLEFLAVFAKA
jgi:polyisoprenoid-binding protein YceI